MERVKELSRREEEVISLLLQGKSNKQIAYALGISERTVEFHLKNIYDKFQVSSRVELILKLGKNTGDHPIQQGESTGDSGAANLDNGNKPDSHITRAHSLGKKVVTVNKESAMSSNIRIILSAITVILGIVLMIGGIITDKNGAVVVGLCASVAAVTHWVITNRQSPKSSE